MLDFNNTEIAFSAKSQSELKNAYLLFNTIKYPWLVKCASVVSNIALNIHFPLGGRSSRLCTSNLSEVKLCRTVQRRSTICGNLMYAPPWIFQPKESKRPKEYKLLLRKPYVRLILQREMIIWPMPYSNRPPS